MTWCILGANFHFPHFSDKLLWSLLFLFSFTHLCSFQSLKRCLLASLTVWQPHFCEADNGGVCPQAGHQTADQHPAEPGLEGFSQWGSFHHDGIHLSHTHGAASSHGAKSQVGRRKRDESSSSGGTKKHPMKRDKFYSFSDCTVCTTRELHAL